MAISFTTTSHSTDATAIYLRRARRVRARYGHDPARMHRELLKLARSNETDAALPRPPRARRIVSSVLPLTIPFRAHPAVAQAFADEVERATQGGVLRYSRRAALLRRAGNLDIGRFEANLIIATVLHRHGDVIAIPDARAGGSRRWRGTIAVVLTIQIMIAAAVWWVIAA